MVVVDKDFGITSLYFGQVYWKKTDKRLSVRVRVIECLHITDVSLLEGYVVFAKICSVLCYEHPLFINPLCNEMCKHEQFRWKRVKSEIILLEVSYNVQNATNCNTSIIDLSLLFFFWFITLCFCI